MQYYIQDEKYEKSKLTIILLLVRKRKVLHVGLMLLGHPLNEETLIQMNKDDNKTELSLSKSNC